MPRTLIKIDQTRRATTTKYLQKDIKYWLRGCVIDTWHSNAARDPSIDTNVATGDHLLAKQTLPERLRDTHGIRMLHKIHPSTRTLQLEIIHWLDTPWEVAWYTWHSNAARDPSIDKNAATGDHPLARHSPWGCVIHMAFECCSRSIHRQERCNWKSSIG
jgi:hypothetical protein